MSQSNLNNFLGLIPVYSAENQLSTVCNDGEVYGSTNLIDGNRVPRVDIEFQVQTFQELELQIKNFNESSHSNSDQQVFIDPELQLRACQRDNPMVETLVEYERIHELAIEAEKLMSN